MPTIPTPKVSPDAKAIVERILDDFEQTIMEHEVAKDKRTLLNPEYLNSEVRALRRIMNIVKDELNVRTDEELKDLLKKS